MTCKERYIVKRVYALIILFSLLCIRFIIDKKENHLNPIYQKIDKFEKSVSKSFFYSFFIENEVSIIKKFRKLNTEDIWLDKNNFRNFKRKENPEVSVIITVYNQADCFYKGLRSVQNQSLKNIEIIIVDDCSIDNSVDKIEKYQKEDNRIILIKHNINYGKIKSRSDAIKLAKGKYITIIDGDDALAQKNILFNCLTIAKIGNLDIIEFKLISFYRTYFRGDENNVDKIKNINSRIIYQPELKYKFIKLNELWSFKNRNICQKFIKNEVSKKMIEYIGSKYTEAFMLEFEDTIMAISLFIISRSYYLMKNIGYYRAKDECFENISENKKCNTNNIKIIKQIDSMRYINFLSEKLENNIFNSQFIYLEILTVFRYHHNFEENINTDYKY